MHFQNAYSNSRTVILKTAPMQTTEPYESTDATTTLKELFWKRGYERTSIEDVVQATGMNRYALYNAFGGKRDLFLAALDDYYFERKSVFLENLNSPETPPLDAVRGVMEFAIAELADRGAGCLLCNVANDMGPTDPVIAARVDAYLTEIEFAYGEALVRAEDAGALNPNISPQDGAKMLIAIQLGIGVRAKAGAKRDQLLEILNAALRALAHGAA